MADLARTLPNCRAVFIEVTNGFWELTVKKLSGQPYSWAKTLRKSAGAGSCARPAGNRRASDYGSAAREQTDDKEHDGNDEQHMHERADRIGADDAQ